MINRDSEVTFDESNVPLQEPLLLSHPPPQHPVPTDIPHSPAEVIRLAETHPTAPKQRLQSLDAYRGLTMLGMILVDYMNEDIPGACWWLIHPGWNGFTPADLVFPAFLFIMGLAIPLAVSKDRPVRPKNVMRVILLFVIGLALNIIEQQFDFANLRILGILQRMSVCYGLVLLVHWATDYAQNAIKRTIAAFFMVGLVILYLALMLPWSDESIGCKRDNNLDPYCNFAGYVDRAIFTEAHIMEKTDPEGVISTLTSVFTTYVGYCFGLMLMKLKSTPERLVKYWLLIAFICLLPVYPCSLLMPLNKRLYTITFLFLVLACTATALSFFLLIVDIMPQKHPQTAKVVSIFTRPLTWLGMNPLAIFVTIQLTADLVNDYIRWGDDQTPYTAIYDAVFSWLPASVGTAAYSVFWAIIFTLWAGLLYRLKIFIRL